LAQFLIQAFRANGEVVLPMVIAAQDSLTQQWLAVTVSTVFEFGDDEILKFGTYLQEAAQRTEIEIDFDSCDSFACQVSSDLLPAFIN